MCLRGVCSKGDEICPLGNSAGRVVLQGIYTEIRCLDHLIKSGCVARNCNPAKKTKHTDLFAFWVEMLKIQ